MMSAVVALRLALLQTIGARIAFSTNRLQPGRFTAGKPRPCFPGHRRGREEVTEHWYDQLFLISHDVAFTEITDQTIHLGDD